MSKIKDYRDAVLSDLGEIKGNVKLVMEINNRQDIHLEKLNGKIAEHESFKIKAKTWGSMALIIVPLVISILARVLI